MNLEKLNPWNWFKHEGVEQVGQKQIPVARSEVNNLAPMASADSLLRLHSEMDKLFDNVFNSFGMPALRSAFPNQRLSAGFPSGDFMPQVDIAGDEKQYDITLDVPGLSESDLSIDVKGDLLVIKGQKEEKSESKDKQFYRAERSYGSFQRTLSLPDDAVTEEIKANLKDGVLKLEIPRREVADKDIKRINISSS